MFETWRNRRSERRRRQGIVEDQLAQDVRVQSRGIVQEVVGPLEQAGAARVEWDEPGSPRYADGVIDVHPVRTDAAPVSIDPGPDWITLSAGAGNLEISIDRHGEWVGYLRCALEAVVAGRYREICTQGAVSGRLEMIFEVPGRADLVSKYYADFDEADLGQRKYKPYG
ncbi:MAG: hypothetical protein WDZ46_00360 [Solirubrobacterales bacterium]